MTQEQALNPTRKYMFYFVLAVFAWIGAAQIPGLEPMMSRGRALVLCFLAALAALIWLSFEFRRGAVDLVDQRGRIFTYKLKKEPVLFVLISLLYLAMAISTFLYTGTQLLAYF